MPANANSILAKGFIAATDIPQYAPVTFDGNIAAAGAVAIGFANESVKAGRRMLVTVQGTASAFAGAAITTGQALQVGAGSTVVPKTSGRIIGQALNSGGVGDAIEVLIKTDLAENPGLSIDLVTGRVTGIQGVLNVAGQTAVPTILLPAGTWANISGQLTVGTALPYLPAGVVNVYLFASGITTAGLYFATFTGSAASPVCQVWTDAAATMKPVTVAGAYTPTLGSVVGLANIIVNNVGINGRITTEAFFAMQSSANTKRCQIIFGGTVFKNIPVTTNISLSLKSSIANRGAANSQYGFSDGTPTDLGAGNANTVYAAVDTSTDQTLSISASINTSTAEFVILEGYRVEVLPLA